MSEIKKTGFDIWICIPIFVENWPYYDKILNFSVWLRTGSDTAYIN